MYEEKGVEPSFIVASIVAVIMALFLGGLWFNSPEEKAIQEKAETERDIAIQVLQNENALKLQEAERVDAEIYNERAKNIEFINQQVEEQVKAKAEEIKAECVSHFESIADKSSLSAGEYVGLRLLGL